MCPEEGAPGLSRGVQVVAKGGEAATRIFFQYDLVAWSVGVQGGGLNLVRKAGRGGVALWGGAERLQVL